MAIKITTFSIILPLCFSSLLCFAYGNDQANDTYVEGWVYCDTCRVQQRTKLSTDLPGATVRLSCKDRFTDKETFSMMAVADENGKYKIPVIGDHQSETCEVLPVMSHDMQCSDNYGASAKISLTKKKSIYEAIPLMFMRKKPLPECEDMDLTPIV